MSFARRFFNGIFGKYMSDNASPSPPNDAQADAQAPGAGAEPALDADPLAVAQAELAVLQAKSAELADQYLRAKADAENARRRAEGERLRFEEEQRQRAEERVVAVAAQQ